MLYLLFAINLIVSPDPVKTDISTPVKITVSTDKGIPVKDVRFVITPSTLGRIKDGVFIPSSIGKGVLLCKANVDGKHLRKPVYVVVSEVVSGKSPPRARA